MPYVHQRAFRVRHYECDLYGRLTPAAMLGYMQEAAFDGSAAVGYGAAKYAEIGLYWLAYETEVEVVQPVHYGDTIDIKTWVVDFRRVRSLRNYELYRGGELVARGSTDWVLLDTRTNSITTIPPEIITAYARGETVTPAPARPPFPPARRPEQGVFSLHRRVEWRDIDPAGHVNNAVYLHYVADAEIQAYQSVGWPPARFQMEGALILPRRHQIEYKAAALLDDELEIATWLSDLDAENGTGLRHTTVSRVNADSTSKLLTRVRALWMWADSASEQAAPIPAAFVSVILPASS